MKHSAVEHSLEPASERIEGHFEHIPLEIEAAVAWEIEEASATAEHRERLDYFHELEVGDTRIEEVICTFASDLVRGREY